MDEEMTICIAAGGGKGPLDLRRLGDFVTIEATYLPKRERRELADRLALQFLFAYHRGDEAVQESVDRTVNSFLAKHPTGYIINAGVGL